MNVQKETDNVTRIIIDNVRGISFQDGVCMSSISALVTNHFIQILDAELKEAKRNINLRIREAVLVGRTYGQTQEDDPQAFKKVNDWLISEGVEPFGERANKRVVEGE